MCNSTLYHSFSLYNLETAHFPSFSQFSYLILTDYARQKCGLDNFNLQPLYVVCNKKSQLPKSLCKRQRSMLDNYEIQSWANLKRKGLNALLSPSFIMYDIHLQNLQQKFQLLNPSGHLDIYKIQSWAYPRKGTIHTNHKSKSTNPHSELQETQEPRNGNHWLKQIDGCGFLGLRENLSWIILKWSGLFDFMTFLMLCSPINLRLLQYEGKLESESDSLWLCQKVKVGCSTLWHFLCFASRSIGGCHNIKVN